MRKFMQIIAEAENDNVVPFGKKPQKPQDGFTQDEKYRGAGATQASGLTKDLKPDNPFHQHVAQHIQDIFTTMAAGRELSDEQKHESRMIIKISDMRARNTVHGAVYDIIQQYNKGKAKASERIILQYKSPEQAYLHDDPEYLKDRLTTAEYNGRTIFSTSNVIDLYEYVFEHYLPLTQHPEEIVQKWVADIAQIVANKSVYDGDKPDFDPHTDQWFGVTVHVEKLLRKWRTSKEDGVGVISTSSHSYAEDTPEMEFWPANRTWAWDETPARTVKFNNRDELNQYVQAHEHELDAWWEAQQAQIISPNNP
jgi:hypothetical protein